MVKMQKCITVKDGKPGLSGAGGLGVGHIFPGAMAGGASTLIGFKVHAAATMLWR